MTLFGRLTLYRIRRDHSAATGFFFVRVPEAKMHGAGVQLNLRGVLYGVSFHTKSSAP